jgi:hypothetical protein
MLTVMNAWRRRGLAGHKISAYAEVTTITAAALRQVVWVLGSAPVGICIPDGLLPYLDDPSHVWDVPQGGAVGEWAPNPYNGHAVPLMAYGSGQFRFPSWGAVYTMTDAFANAYIDEAYAPLSLQDWVRMHYAPNGFAVDALISDVAAIQASAGGQ